MLSREYKLKGNKVPQKFVGLVLRAPVFETEADVEARIPDARSRIANQQSAFDVSWQDMVRRVSGKKDQTAEGIQAALDAYVYKAREESDGTTKGTVRATKQEKEVATAAKSGFERAVLANDRKRIAFYIAEGLGTEEQAESIRQAAAAQSATATA